MRQLGLAFAFAAAHVLHPRMLWLMLWPVVLAAGAWGMVVIAFWAQFVVWLAGVLRGWIETATFFVSWDASDIALLLAKIATIIAVVPLVQVTALALLGAFGMSAIVEHVAAKRYPELARRGRESLARSIASSVAALAGLAVLALLTLPLWIFPPLWPVIPVCIAAWFNQRVLRYDALATHADAAEARAVWRAQRGGLFLLGLALALVAYVPLIGLFAPVFFGLAFAHLLLGRLEALRTGNMTRESST